MACKLKVIKKVGEVWRCEICGNVVQVLEVGGAQLFCCKKPMIAVKEKAKSTKK
ncbi:MAG: desulfoferrodoxin FeS4 iron-binding domain-containing protein [Kiritimatiellia bacterium]|jgi:desulfoferrodoxin-like iron-binding protein